MANVVKKNNGEGFFAVEAPESVNFNGTSVRLPKTMFYYAAAKAAFTPVYEKCLADAKSRFDAEVGTMEKFVHNAKTFFPDCCKPLISFCIQKLAEHGSFELNEEDFYDKYMEADDFQQIDEILNEMTEKYIQIRERQEAKEAERKARRDAEFEDRSHESVLGAFGGAMKNSFVDSLKSGWDEANNESEAAAYFTAEKKAALLENLDYIFFKILEDFTIALKDTVNLDLENPVSWENERKANNMFDKLKDGTVPENKMAQVALEVFKLNPLTEGLLPWCVQKYKDKTGDFQKIAKLLSKEEEVIVVKESLLKSAFKAVKIDTEEHALEAKKKFLEQEKDLCYSSTQYEKKINDALYKFDLQARTVEGVEYKTREEASDVKGQLSKFSELEKKHGFKTSNDCNLFLDEIKNAGLACSAVEKHLSKYRQMSADLDKKERTVDGIEFKTHEEADIARKEFSALNTILKSRKVFSAKDAQVLIDEIEKASFTSGIEKKALNKLSASVTEFNEKHQKLLGRFKLNEKDIDVLTAQMACVQSAKVEYLQFCEPLDAGTEVKAASFNIPTSEPMFGQFDFGTSGIAMAQTGVYLKTEKTIQLIVWKYFKRFLIPMAFFVFIFLCLIIGDGMTDKEYDYDIEKGREVLVSESFAWGRLTPLCIAAALGYVLWVKAKKVLDNNKSLPEHVAWQEVNANGSSNENVISIKAGCLLMPPCNLNGKGQEIASVLNSAGEVYKKAEMEKA